MSFVRNYYFPRNFSWYQGICSLDGPRKFSALCSLIAMCVNDLRNNETVIVTSEKIDTGYTYFQRFFFITRGRLKYICGTKTNVILA